MDEYNISNTDHIIIYGRESVLFTPRTWFMFKSFGHDPSKLHLMQGSFEEWVDVGGAIDVNHITVPRAKDVLDRIEDSSRETVATAANNSPSSYTTYTSSHPSFIYTMGDVQKAINNNKR